MTVLQLLKVVDSHATVGQAMHSIQLEGAELEKARGEAERKHTEAKRELKQIEDGVAQQKRL